MQILQSVHLYILCLRDIEFNFASWDFVPLTSMRTTLYYHEDISLYKLS